MAVAVAGQFMSIGDNSLYKMWITLGNPSERKKGGFRGVVIEHTKNSIDIPLDTAFPRNPLLSRDVRCESRHLKIVLDVDGQGIFD
jgi:hypothetical protein